MSLLQQADDQAWRCGAGRLVNWPAGTSRLQQLQQIGDATRLQIPCLAKWSARRRPSRASRARHVGANLSARGQTQKATSCWCPQLFSRPRPEPAIGGSVTRTISRQGKRTCGPELASWQTRFASIPRANAAHRNGETMTIVGARGGFDSTSRWVQPRSCADLDARVFAALQTFRRRRAGRSCSRVNRASVDRRERRGDAVSRILNG